MGNKRGGVVSLRLNGQQLEVVGNWTFIPGTPTREAIVGNTVHGYKETPKAPRLEGTVTWSPDLDLVALGNLDDATITCEWPNGEVITLRNAWTDGEISVSAESGEMSLAFAGKGFDID